MLCVNIPNDLSKIKTKMAFNLTKHQLTCFGGAAAIGTSSYPLAQEPLGNTGAMFLMPTVMLPASLLVMYEEDELPFEKMVHNTIRAKFLWPRVRHYQTENIYAPFTGQSVMRKEDAIVKGKKQKQSRKG